VSKFVEIDEKARVPSGHVTFSHLTSTLPHYIIIITYIMAFIKRLVTKACRGNTAKVYISKAAFIAGLSKALYYI
jgi:hypothetical protein